MSVMPLSLEIDGRTWTATNPKEICRGECEGPIEYVPNLAGFDGWLDEHLAAASTCAKKRIYVCDSTAIRLRPLIPHAQGFLFGGGTTLGHFARILRHHRIPACIDQNLWQGARAAVLTTRAGRSCRLRCGPEVVLPEDVRARYQAQLKDYWQRLGGHPVAIPVYDAASRIMEAMGTTIDRRIGEKALAVNALQAEGLPTAKALILANLDGNNPHLDKDLVDLVGQVFPLFGHMPGYALIVRGSLYSGDSPHRALSGLVKSPSVTSLADLARAIVAQMRCWQGVRDFDHRLGLSIIVQERIAAPIRGILGTGRPWDYCEGSLVAELTFVQGKGAAPSEVFLDDVKADLQSGLVRERVRLLSKQDEIVDSKEFCDMLARLVRDGLVLRDRCSVPLDIEFVVTGDLRYVVVQFRPLFLL